MQEAYTSRLPKDAEEYADLVGLVFSAHQVFLSKLYLQNCTTASAPCLQLCGRLNCQHLDDSQRLELC